MRYARALLRIFFNAPNPSLQGGPATHLPLLKRALDRYADVKTFRHGRARDDESGPRKILQTISNLAAVEYKILRHGPDVIHINSAFDTRSVLRDAPLALLAARHGVPIVLKVHGSFPETIRSAHMVVAAAKRVLLSSVSALCVLSKAEKEEFEEYYPQLNGRVYVVKNIISECFFNVERREASEPLILFASRFVRKKGPFQLLEAIGPISKRVPGAKFVFLGNGPDAPSFDAEVSARGLGGVVSRIPNANRSEMAEWYAHAWVLVFPTSYEEGMPMVIAEAMASGTPIVTSRTRFCRSYMTENDNCLYCDPQSPDSIANQLVMLLGDPGMRRSMSIANRALAQQFREDIVAREFVQIYQRICRAAAEFAPVATKADRFTS